VALPRSTPMPYVLFASSTTWSMTPLALGEPLGGWKKMPARPLFDCRRVGDGKCQRPGRRQHQDAVARGEIAAIVSEILQGCSWVTVRLPAAFKTMPLKPAAGTVDFQPDQGDGVAASGIDSDAVAGGRRRDRRPAVAVDGDRSGDGQRAVFARIERGDDAAGRGQRSRRARRWRTAG